MESLANPYVWKYHIGVFKIVLSVLTHEKMLVHPDWEYGDECRVEPRLNSKFWIIFSGSVPSKNDHNVNRIRPFAKAIKVVASF